MEYKEKLVWILDAKNKNIDREIKTQENIDFIHSLGLKCDCVGWSELNLNNPNADEIIKKIKDFCKTKKRKVRGYYIRETEQTESNWYKIKTINPKEGFIGEYIKVETEDNRKMITYTIRAYKEIKQSPKGFCLTFISEKLKNAIIETNIKNVKFCWAKDIGRYQSPQYFNIYPLEKIKRYANNEYIRDYEKPKKIKDIIKCNKQKNEINKLGGSLSKIINIFSKLEIILPNIYLTEDFPEKGIISSYNKYSVRPDILIDKETVKTLIEKKAITYNDLEPIYIKDELPEGYHFIEIRNPEIPNQKYIDELNKEYEKFKLIERPKRSVTENDAIKIMKQTKKQRKEDFQKSIKKEAIEPILNTNYKKLLPYYQIANGGYLSDEYELLSYNDAINENQEFFKELKKEELLKEQINGVVFAKAMNGDFIILCNNDKVVKFSHEEPNIIDEWESLEEFIFDNCLEEND